MTCGNFDNINCGEYGEPYCTGYKRFMKRNHFKFYCEL